MRRIDRRQDHHQTDPIERMREALRLGHAQRRRRQQLIRIAFAATMVLSALSVAFWLTS